MQEYDFEIYRGDDTEFTVSVTDDDGFPIDLTGIHLSMLIRPQKGDTYMLDIGNGLTVLGNVIKVHFSHDLTKEWTFNNAEYDLQFVDTRGYYKTYLRGNVIVTKDITP